MGWDLLMDENRKIKVDGEELCIVGVQNWGTGRFPKHGDIKKALMGTEKAACQVAVVSRSFALAGTGIGYRCGCDVCRTYTWYAIWCTIRDVAMESSTIYL
jgi:hypothetical protein